MDISELNNSLTSSSEQAGDQNLQQFKQPNPLQERGQMITDEQYNEIARKLTACLIKNVPDEVESPALFSFNGVEVICKQALSLTSGWKKAGKTNMSGLLMTAAVSPNHEALNGQIKSLLGSIKIATLDTEQPLKDARRTYRRVMQTAGFPLNEEWTDHGIFNFSVKDFKESDVYIAAEVICKTIKPDLLIIDGIADIMQSINKEDEAKLVFKWAAWLAQEYDCAVMGMLHLNQGSDKIGGWAGTQAGKKYTDGFMMKKDKGCFTIVHEGRGESAPDLRFRIEREVGDKYGRWIPVDSFEVDALDPEDRKMMEMENLATEMPLPCKRVPLINFVKQYYFVKGKPIKDETAVRIIKDCRKCRLIDSKKEGRESVYFKTSNTDEKEK